MGLLNFQLKAPEVATIIRWLLRVILVGFLFWLVKGRQEQDQEEEEEVDEEPKWQQSSRPRGGAHRPANNSRFQNKGRDPYAPRDTGPRQRRMGPPEGGSVDFDAVINKMSKPKNMWEVTKDGAKSGPPQIIKRNASSDAVDGNEPQSLRPPKEAGHAASQKKEDANSLLKKTMLHGHMRPVTYITWNREANLLFTCGKDKKVCVWSFPDGECLGNYEGHTGAVWACSVTADSSWLVTSGADNLVLVWEAQSSREVCRVELPGVVRFVEWAGAGGSASSSQGERFVTASNRFGKNPAALTVWRFDGIAGSIEEQMKISTLPTTATQVRWGKGDVELASAHENGELIFWRADTGEEVRRLKAHDSVISKFDFSSDREMVATVSTDKFVKVWDLGEGSEGKLLYDVETDRPLNAVAFGKLTRAMAVGPESDRPRCVTVIAAGGQDVRDVAMTGSSSEQFDGLCFRLGGASKLEADGSTKGHFGPVHTVAFTADGSAMASGSEDGCIRLHLFDGAALKEAAANS